MAATLLSPDIRAARTWVTYLAQQLTRGREEVLQALKDYLESIREECAHEVARWGVDPTSFRSQVGTEPIVAAANWARQAESELERARQSQVRLEELAAQILQDLRALQIRDAIEQASLSAGRAFRDRDSIAVRNWRSAESALERLLETTGDLDPSAERVRWVELVRDLTRELTEWANHAGWRTSSQEVARTEELLGTYVVPILTIETEFGTVKAEPIARRVMGALGRIDLYAYPTMHRVMLLKDQSGDWRVRTDSGIVLPIEWNRESFIGLVRALAMVR